MARKLLYKIEVCRLAAITGAAECRHDGYDRLAADLSRTAARLTRVRSYLIERLNRGN